MEAYLITTMQESLPNIYNALQQLLKEAGGEDSSKAALFNLIVYVDDPKKVDHFAMLVKNVVSKFPSRVIFLIQSAESVFHVNTALETLHEGDAKIFCERITLTFGIRDARRAAFLLLPHILPDLPLYLLWAEDPQKEDVIFPFLSPYADRIIFDKQEQTGLIPFCRSVLALPLLCEVGDLHWSSLSGWRKLFMQTFNSFEALEVLEETHLLKITYVEGQEIEAAYFQSWLASRLNWQWDAFELVEGHIRIRYMRPTHETVVLLEPIKSATLPKGALVTIHLTSFLRESSYHFTRQEETRLVQIQISDALQCALPISAHLPGVTEGQEILEELFYPSSKKHYLHMLESLIQIPWEGLGS